MSPGDVREVPIFAERQVGVISEITWGMKVKTKWLLWVGDVPGSRGVRCCSVRALAELKPDEILNAVTILFL